MSSREIAELTGKRHADVIRDVTRMFDQMGAQDRLRSFAQWVRVETGSGTMRDFLIYNLPYDETITLVSGYNVQMRAAIIDRWQERENSIPVPVALTSEQQLANAGILTAESRRSTFQQSRDAGSTSRFRRMDKSRDRKGWYAPAAYSSNGGIPTQSRFHRWWKRRLSARAG